jgi:hypothetical protein
MAIITQDSSGQLWQITVKPDGTLVTTAVSSGITSTPPTNFVSSYEVKDALALASTLAKGVPFTNVDMLIADVVNSIMYKAYPWRDTLVNFAAGSLPLADATQDYSVVAPYTGTIFRVTQFSIARTDTSPVQVREIRVAKNLTVDLISKSPNAVRAASYQAGVGMFRLESAVQVTSGATWELRGEYQPYPAKISDPSDHFWFADEHLEVFAKGLAYWAYRMADDARMGSMQTVNGRAVYTGALGEFMQAIADMAAAEDFGNLDGYYPDDVIGTVDGRRYYSSDVYPIL